MADLTIPVRAESFIFYCSLVSQTDTKTYQSNPTLAAGDVQVSKDGGTLANLATLPTVTPASGKLVKVSLSADEMTADNVAVVFSDAAGAQWCDFTVNIQTAARGVDDLAFPTTTGRSLAVNTLGVVDAQVKDIDAGAVDVTAAPNLDAAISTRLATSGYTAPPAAIAVADQVWDEAISGHVSAGSTGSKLNTLTNSSDPLGSAVPGSYATGTAGSALGRIGTGQITTVSPVAQSGDITIIRGDDYSNNDNRSLEWTEVSGNNWPTLTGGSITFYLGTENNLIFSKTGSIVTATGSSKKVRVELTNTDTINFSVGRHLFSIRAIVNNRYATLVNAFCNISVSPKTS